MFTLAAYSSSAAGINAALTGLAAVQDPHLRVSGNDVIVPTALNKIAACHAVGATITRAQLQSPSLRAFVNLDIEPLEAAAIPGSPNPFYANWEDVIALQGEEALNAFITNTASDRETVLVWLSDGPLMPVDQDYRTVRFTASTTLTAGSWTNCILTQDQVLPAGVYQIIGMRARSTNLIAARLVFVNYQWRPGVLGCQAATNVHPPNFRFGNAGIYGQFTHNTPPTVDCLANAGDTSEIFEFDIVKVG